MSKDLTVKQVKARKAVLEGEIEDKLKEFFKETDTIVSDINLDNVDMTSFEDEKKKIQPTIKLNLQL